jgi:hypothetical protein
VSVGDVKQQQMAAAQIAKTTSALAKHGITTSMTSHAAVMTAYVATFLPIYCAAASPMT